MFRSCRRCSAEFVPFAEWAVYCKPCAVERKRLIGLFDAGVRLLANGHAFDDADDDQPDAHIPPEMYRRLIQLCHPDRHGNSQAAQNATTWLLAQREVN